MANICEFTCVVVADYETNLAEFEDILRSSARRTTSDIDKADYGCFPAVSEVTRTELIRGHKYGAIYMGECRWSCYSSFRKGEYTYHDGKFHHTGDNPEQMKYACIEDVSEKLGLEVELFGKEPMMGFSEYHHIKDGEVLEDCNGYFMTPIIAGYDTYEDFINDENNKVYKKYMSKSIFDDAKKEGLSYIDLIEYDYPRNSKLDIYSTQCDPKYDFNIETYKRYAKACKEYSDYIYEHINNVQIVYQKLKHFLVAGSALYSRIYMDRMMYPATILSGSKGLR